jgi:hypothetical protein
VGGKHLANAGQRLLRLAFLEKADDRVDDHHAENHAGVHPVTQGRGNTGRRDEDVDQQIVEVFEEAFEQTFLGRFGQAVRPDGFEPLGGFVGTQALGRTVELPQHLVARQRVGFCYGMGRCGG